MLPAEAAGEMESLRLLPWTETIPKAVNGATAVQWAGASRVRVRPRRGGHRSLGCRHRRNPRERSRLTGRAARRQVEHALSIDRVAGH